MSTQDEYAGRHWKTKAEIAGHFQIGLRTVTKLMQRRILPFAKLRNLVRFDPSECDQIFGSLKTRTRFAAKKTATASDQKACCWRTKRQVAVHFHISVRSVTTLMRQRQLPYVKLGRLVRLDLVECDDAMHHYQSKSLLARRLPTGEDS
jgi:hypothetical protein